jgi:hypothetical protein
MAELMTRYRLRQLSGELDTTVHLDPENTHPSHAPDRLRRGRDLDEP